MPRPKINGIELNKRDINIRQVYVTIRHIASESDENYKEISIMVLIFVDKDSNMNMTKGALILSLSFLLAACSSIPQGRLLARQSGFLDPVNYRNHFVTILGTIQGEQPGFINKVPYNFLEVNMQGIQVWHLREVVNTTYNLWDYGYGAFWPEPGWGAPYYTNAVSQVTPELVK